MNQSLWVLPLSVRYTVHRTPPSNTYSLTIFISALSLPGEGTTNPAPKIARNRKQWNFIIPGDSFLTISPDFRKQVCSRFVFIGVRFSPG